MKMLKLHWWPIRRIWLKRTDNHPCLSNISMMTRTKKRIVIKSRILRRKTGLASRWNHCNTRVELGMVILLVDMGILNTATLDLDHVGARRAQRKAEVREEIDGVMLDNRLLSIKRIKLVQVVQ